MSLSLRQRILAWSGASTLVIVLTVFLFVDSAFRTMIRSDLEENLSSGVRLAAELRASQMGELIREVATVALNPLVKGAVETGDPNYMLEILEEIRNNLPVDWLALTSHTGELLASTEGTPAGRLTQARALIREVRYYDSGDLWSVEGALVEVAASTIYFGGMPLGILLAGTRIDSARVADLETSTQQRVAFLSKQQIVSGYTGLAESSAQMLNAWSEPPAATHAVPGTPGGGGLGRAQEFALEGEKFLGAAVPLLNASRERVGDLVVFHSLDAALQPARRLRLALLAIAGGGLLLALVFSLVLSRSITHPVSRLLEEMARIGTGDLNHPVKPVRHDEIGKLAEGFEQMRVSLSGAQDELIQAERLSAIGRAAGAIVHDLAQPITVIGGYVDLLPSEEDEEERGVFYDVIRKQLDRLTTIRQEILEFVRGEERIDRRPVGVPQLIDELARTLKPGLQKNGIGLRVEHGYTGLWSMDVSGVSRVLENLVRNAQAAIQSDGTITIRTAATDGALRVEVEDTGPGIPEEIRGSLFEPFVTQGKKEGTGLGLAIVRNIVERHGGAIHFTSSPAGTVFVLEFAGDGEANLGGN